eukprot:SM000020S06092  [mRNA]  locus=s20:1081255:1081544:+ [translate_table: standard]
MASPEHFLQTYWVYPVHSSMQFRNFKCHTTN